MLKDNRLRKNWQFQEIIEKNKQIVTKSLVVYFIPNNLNSLRVGISISKKFENAVGRNRQRRQVRASLDLLKEMFNKSFDIVLILRKPFLTMDHEDKTKALKEALERL